MQGFLNNDLETNHPYKEEPNMAQSATHKNVG